MKLKPTDDMANAIPSRTLRELVFEILDAKDRDDRDRAARLRRLAERAERVYPNWNGEKPCGRTTTRR